MSETPKKRHFPGNYVDQTLIPDLNTTILMTELSGIRDHVARFSYAEGKSTLSFGLYQYDVGARDPAIKDFLTELGFTDYEIKALGKKQDSSDYQGMAKYYSVKLREALHDPVNAQRLEDLDRQWAERKIEHLEQVLERIGQENPAIAEQIWQSTELQLRLLDYDNQFGISLTQSTTMLDWLCNQPAERVLTGSDIREFILGLKEGKEHPRAMLHRENMLDMALERLRLNGLHSETPAPGESIPFLQESGIGPPLSAEVLATSGMAVQPENPLEEALLCTAGSIPDNTEEAVPATSWMLADRNDPTRQLSLDNLMEPELLTTQHKSDQPDSPETAYDSASTDAHASGSQDISTPDLIDMSLQPSDEQKSEPAVVPDSISVDTPAAIDSPPVETDDLPLDEGLTDADDSSDERLTNPDDPPFDEPASSDKQIDPSDEQALQDSGNADELEEPPTNPASLATGEPNDDERHSDDIWSTSNVGSADDSDDRNPS